MNVDEIREDYLMAISAAKAEMKAGNYDLAFKLQDEAEELFEKLIWLESETLHDTESDDICYFELGD